MAKKNRPIKTNLNINYLIPLCPRTDPYNTILREAKVISSTNGILRFQAVEDPELFEIHTFWDEYFQWLIHINHVIPIET